MPAVRRLHVIENDTINARDGPQKFRNLVPRLTGKHNPHFNPFYIRSRIDSIGYTINRRVKSGTYNPNPALLVGIPKPTGGTRDISISTIPDAAVSYWLGQQLLNRNAHRFSSYTYAYRADRNAHHAIYHLMSDIRGQNRLFVLEYDFSKYFDSIWYAYLKATLTKHFEVSARELSLITKLLNTPRARSVADYQASTFETPTLGIPQGSSVSLFLANVACYELDREIEKVGVVFARYADDTLIVTDSYEKADLCAKLLIAWRSVRYED